MVRWILRIIAAVGVLAAAALGACFLLPERFAVNVPIRNALFGTPGAPPAPGVLGSRIRVPEGLSIGLFAELPRVRALRPTPTGDLLASVPREGKVVLLERDGDGDGRSDGARTLLEGLNRPHGMDLHDGWLYVAETDAIGRVRFDPGARSVSGGFERVVTGLPAGGNHWTRTIRFGAGRLAVRLGGLELQRLPRAKIRAAPRCCASVPTAPSGETYATGLRNAVGFDWRPDTDELYATDNGRDLLGDDYPALRAEPRGEGRLLRLALRKRRRGRRIRISARATPRRSRRRSRRPMPSAPTTRPSASSSCSAISRPGSRAGRRSWRSTARGTAPTRTATRSSRCTSSPTAASRSATSSPASSRRTTSSGGRWTWRRARTAPSTSPTTTRAPSIESPAGAQAAAAAARASGAPSTRDPLAGVPETERAAASARGAALYEANACFRCHEAARAEAGVVAVPLAKLRERYDVAALAALLATPTPPMPVFALSDAERRELAIHLLAPPR